MKKWLRINPMVVPLTLALLGIPDAIRAGNVALVIGNSDYEHLGQLRTPRNDAKAMAAKLRQLGFDVTVRFDLDRAEFRESLGAFGRASRDGYWTLLYYSGHGVQLDGTNHLMPVNTQLDKSTGGIDPKDAISLDTALGDMGGVVKFVFLDASRNIAPETRATGQREGLARQCTDLDTVVWLAAQPNTASVEGNGRLSPFTRALVRHLDDRCVNVNQVFARVRAAVHEHTENQQSPYVHPFKDFYGRSFAGRGCPSLPPPRIPFPAWPRREQDAWREVQHSRDVTDYDAFLKAFPDGECCQMAKARRRELRLEEAAWQRARELGRQEGLVQFLKDYPDGRHAEPAKRMLDGLTPDGSARPALGDSPAPPEEWTNGLGMDFALVPAGTFDMGSSSGRWRHRQPLMRVRITEAFHLGKHEVTQGQWAAVMGSNPSEFKGCGPNCPVENVNWNDAQEFIRRLNEAEEGSRYRLPTEAEWEYAARGGMAAERHGRLDDIAWWQGNSDGQTHPVGTMRANDFGIYDMLGNVREWVADWHWEYRDDGHRFESRSAIAPACPCPEPIWQSRVIRGCGWNDEEEDCRSGTRFKGPAWFGYQKARWDNSFGFRVLRELEARHDVSAAHP